MKSINPLCIAVAVLIALVGFRNGLKEGPLASTSPAAWLADTLKTDAETGLIDDKNLPLIKANCTGCHSTKLILQHRFTREGWVGKIRWMQHNHNLWDLGESEKVVLDYLEKYYSPQSALSNPHVRRAPLKDIKWYPL
jgi:hypothetical protein